MSAGVTIMKIEDLVVGRSYFCKWDADEAVCFERIVPNNLNFTGEAEAEFNNITLSN